MGFSRSFTFPLSYAEQMAATMSPFPLHSNDAEMLRACEGFQIVRTYLANNRSHPFCNTHKCPTAEDEEAWLLHRDITHALILPILQIFRRASVLAGIILRTETSPDFEIAFRGDARGAFSWLQCFIADEEDWCVTKGCPACTVTYVLQSEPTVRLVLVASRLSQHHRLASDPNSPSLPKFTFWSDSLRIALAKDPFWGPGYFDDIEPRAQQLETGILDLVAQCCTLETLLESSPPVGYKSSSVVSRKSGTGLIEGSGMRLKPSELARNQLSLIKEEENWTRRIILGCWSTLLADAARQWTKGPSSQQRPIAMTRVRSLTS